MENPIKMDDLGVPLFLRNTHMSLFERGLSLNITASPGLEIDGFIRLFLRCLRGTYIKPSQKTRKKNHVIVFVEGISTTT